MEQLLDAITSGAVPLITVALAALVPALTAYAVAWLRARTAAQEMSVRSAVAHVEALKGPAVTMCSEDAHAAAADLVHSALPRTIRPTRAKLDKMIVRAVTALPRNS